MTFDVAIIPDEETRYIKKEVTEELLYNFIQKNKDFGFSIIEIGNRIQTCIFEKFEMN